MRYIVAAAILAVGFATPSFAVTKRMLPEPAPAPTWMECFRLSVYRGTDAWMDEQQDFINQCVEGKISFGDDFPRHAMRQPRSEEMKEEQVKSP